MTGLPVTLQIGDERCIVIGCGPVGARKIAALVACGASVTVIDPKAIDRTLLHGASHLRRPWQRGDGRGALLVVVATNDPEVNEAAGLDSRACGAIVLRADEPRLGQVRSAAVYRSGRVSIAVDSGGAGPGLATFVRDEIAGVDTGWASLAEWAAANRPVTHSQLRERR